MSIVTSSIPKSKLLRNTVIFSVALLVKMRILRASTIIPVNTKQISFAKQKVAIL